jgi:hypothetical protein
MQESTVNKCKKLQYAVTENLIACVQAFLKSCDDSLRSLSESTQSMTEAMEEKFERFEASCELRLRNTLNDFQGRGCDTHTLQIIASPPFQNTLLEGEKDARRRFGSDVMTHISQLHAQVESLASKGDADSELTACVQRLQDIVCRVELDSSKMKYWRSDLSQFDKEMPFESLMMEKAASEGCENVATSEAKYVNLWRKVQALEKEVQVALSEKMPDLKCGMLQNGSNHSPNGMFHSLNGMLVSNSKWSRTIST